MNKMSTNYCQYCLNYMETTAAPGHVLPTNSATACCTGTVTTALPLLSTCTDVRQLSHALG